MQIETLRKIRNFIVRQKVRLDFAMSLLTIFNLGLLIITASDKLNKVFRFDEAYYTYYLVIFVLPAAMLAVWLVGYILDKYVNYQQTVTDALNVRNPQMMKIMEELERINNKLDAIERR